MINGCICGVLILSFLILLIHCSSSSVLPTSSESSAAKVNRRNSCIHNCANCVQFWEHGLYNGERCANKCKRRRGWEVVDPDCNNPLMFNIEMLLEIQRTQPQAEVMQGDQPAEAREPWRIFSTSVQGAQGKTHSKRNRHLGKRNRLRHRHAEDGRWGVLGATSGRGRASRERWD